MMVEHRSLRRRPRNVIAALLVVVSVFLPAAAVEAQNDSPPPEGQAGAEETAAEPSRPQAIPAADISVANQDLAEFIESADGDIELTPAVEEALEKLDEIVAQVGTEVETTEQYLGVDLPERILETLRNNWTRRLEQLDKIRNRLSQHVAILKVNQATLRDLTLHWEITRDAARAEDLPAATQEVIDANLDQLAALDNRIIERRDHLLTAQATIDDQRFASREALNRVKEELKRRTEQMMEAESRPIWQMFDDAPALRAILGEAATLIRAHISSFELDDRNWLEFVAVRMIIFVILLSMFLYLYNRASFFAQHDKTYEKPLRVLGRPISSAFVVFFLGLILVDTHLPLALVEALLFLLLIPLMRLVPRLSPGQYKSGLYMLGVLFFFERTIDFLPTNSWLERLLLVAISLLAMLIFNLFRRRMRRADHALFGSRLANVGALLGLALTGLSLVANILGNATMALALLRGLLTVTYAAVLLYVLVIVLQSGIAVGLRSEITQFSRIVRLHRDELATGLSRVIRFSVYLLWVWIALESFYLLGPLREFSQKVLFTPIELRGFTLTPIDIISFFVAIWLSFLVSRVVRFILEKDVLPRFTLQRGVPDTLLRLIHYGILLVGFFVAVRLAGVGFDRFALIAGAFGVGIGFGLQNIVNNFVSGLVLLFERPIKVGDRVQLADMMCVVKHIGIRASVVRTFQGAEVIVPNGNLISEPVTNWTLSDSTRRIDTDVGVAYGTDPEAVIDVLVGVAKAHPRILATPEPVAYFMGFGESSLDFSLRAWTAEYQEIVATRSELNVGVNKALKEAGFEIPFPQRDLHLRSVDRKAAGSLGATPTGDGDR